MAEALMGSFFGKIKVTLNKIEKGKKTFVSQGNFLQNGFVDAIENLPIVILELGYGTMKFMMHDEMYEAKIEDFEFDEKIKFN